MMAGLLDKGIHVLSDDSELLFVFATRHCRLDAAFCLRISVPAATAFIYYTDLFLPASAS